MKIGDLVIGIASDVSELRTGFQQAKDSADKFSKDLSSALDTAKAAVAALGVALTVDAFVGAIKGAIDYAEKLNNLSQKTGIAVETLGGLNFAASKSGVDLDTVGKAAQKLAEKMAAAAGGNTEAAAVFDKLGISIQNTDGSLKPLDATLVEIAERFASYKDGPEKAALAQELFAKGGAALIPLLNQGGDALRDSIDTFVRYGGVSADTAKRASEFNDTLAKLELMSKGFMSTLAAALLPTLQTLVDKFVEVRGSAGDFNGVIASVVTAVKLIGITLIASIAALDIFGKAIGALAAAAVALGEGEFKRAWSILKDGASDAMSGVSKAISDGKDMWNASTSDMARSSATNGPAMSAPITRAAKDSKDEIDKFIDSMKAAQTADEQGLATNTIKQLGLLEDALGAGKISRDQYNAWVDLILDKDPVLAKEQEAVNKVIKEGKDALDKLNDSWKKEEGALDDRIQKQIDANTAFGLGKAALIDLEIAHVNEKLAVERSGNEYSDYTVHLENTRDKLIQLRDATLSGEQLEAQKKALEAQTKAWEAAAKEWQKFIDDVAAYANDFITVGINDGWRSAFRKLWDDFKAWGIKAIADVAAQKLIVPLIGAAGGLGSTSASAGGFGLGDIENMGSGLWNAFSGGTSSMVGNFAMSGIGQSLGLSAPLIGQAGSLSLGVEAAGAAAGAGSLTGIGSALMTAAPYAAIAAIAIPAIMSFLPSGGGPKSGGFATSGATPGIFGTDSSGRWFTPSGSDAAMLSSVGGMSASYSTLLGLLGGTGSATFAQGFSTDPKGTAASNVHTGAWVGGVQVGNFENAGVGRSDEALQGELATQASRAILAALQASDLPEIVSGYLSSIDVSTATVEQINAALQHAADLKVLVDQVSALPADMATGLLAALGTSDELDARIAAFAASFSAFSVAMDGLQTALDRDPQAEALKAYAAANTTLYDKVGLARDSLTDLVSKYDGSTGATNDLAAATNAYRDAQVAVLVQIESLKTGLAGMFEDSIRQLDWAVMDTAQRGDFLMAEAGKTIGLLQNTTNPTEIEKFSKLINKDLVDAFNLLSPEEQKIQHDAFVQRLADADELVQQRLEASRQEIGDDNANAQTVLGSIRAAMDVAAEKQQQAAQALIDGAQAVKDAAAVIAAAAETSKGAADVQAGAANVQAGAASAMQTATNTPITVWVQESVNP